MRVSFALTLAVLLGLAGCRLGQPHVVVSVTTPSQTIVEVADHLVIIGAGSADPLPRVPLLENDLENGHILTLVANDEGDVDVLIIEARSVDDQVVGRAVLTNIRYKFEDEAPIDAELKVPCDSGLDDAQDSPCVNFPGCEEKKGECIDACDMPSGGPPEDCTPGRGVCTCSGCGDQVIVEPEECEDFDDSNPNEACHQCRLVRWEPRVVVGLATDPLDIPINEVTAVGSDPDGNLFFAVKDFDASYAVWRLDVATGLTTRFLGGGEVPISELEDGTVATTLDLPILDIAVDGLGELYALTGDAIVKVDRGGRARLVAGQVFCATLWSEVPLNDMSGLSALAACFDDGVAVEVGGTGDVYIADRQQNVVYRVDQETELLHVHGGTRFFDFPVDNSQGIAAHLFPLPSPIELAEVAGELFVITAATGNSPGQGAALRSIRNGQGFTVVGVLPTPSVNDLAVWSEGRLLVAGDDGVHVVDGNTVSTLADVDASWPDRDWEVSAIGADAAGRIHVFQNGSTKQLLLYADQRLTPEAGSGARLPCCDDVPGTAVKLGAPEEIAQLPSGEVLITSFLEERIRILDRNTHRVRTWIGAGISAEALPDTPLALQTIRVPRSVATTSDGTVYFADADRGLSTPLIWRVGLTDNEPTQVGGATRPLLFGGLDGAGAVTDLVVDELRGLIFYIDEFHRHVRALPLGQGDASTIVGLAGGETGDADGTVLLAPTDIALLPGGDLVVSDGGYGAVYRVDVEDNTICSMARSTGVPIPDCDPLNPIEIEEFVPQAVAVRPEGAVLVATGSVIHRLNPTGSSDLYAGGGPFGTRGDGAAPTQASFSAIADLLVDDKGVSILDDGHLRRIEDGEVRTIAGPIHLGDGPFDKARLQNPLAIAAAGDNRWLVADGAGGRVRELEMVSAVMTTVMGYPGGFDDAQDLQNRALYRQLFQTASGVAWDPGIPDESDAVIYVAERDQHVIWRVNLGRGAEKPVDRWDISLFVGQLGVEGLGNGTLAQGRMTSPGGLAFDEEARVLFVADTGSHSVRAIHTAFGTHEADETVTPVLGVPGVLGRIADGVPAREANLYRPMAVATHRDPTTGQLVLYVADQGNNRVLMVRDPLSETAVSELVLGTGESSSSGDEEVGALSSVDAPAGLGLDSFGNLYVTSTTTVRQVIAGPSGVAQGSDPVRTIYGRAPRMRFPEPVTQCLTDIQASRAPTDQTQLFVLDACQGFVFTLTTKLVPLDDEVTPGEAGPILSP